MTGHCCDTKVLFKELNKKITLQNCRLVLLNQSLLLRPYNVDGNFAFDFSGSIWIPRSQRDLRLGICLSGGIHLQIKQDAKEYF